MHYKNPFYDPKNPYSRAEFDGDFLEHYRGFDLCQRDLRDDEFHAVANGAVVYMCAGLDGLKRHIDSVLDK